MWCCCCDSRQLIDCVDGSLVREVKLRQLANAQHRESCLDQTDALKQSVPSLYAPGVVPSAETGQSYVISAI